MGLERADDGAGKPPLKAHLAVLKDANTYEFIAIPPGALMQIIEDPKDKDKCFPVVLLSVSVKRIVFGCACKRPGCNVRYEFRASRSGNHVSNRR